MLRGKNILLGVTGGIAAYKSAALVRLLIKEGAEVKVILTGSARDFVSPQTLSVLSRNKVYSDFFDQNLQWNNHVELAEWANLIVVAPLTANTLAKMVGGQCDNLLLATLLSARCPIMLAPAMDLEMYRHATVKQNLEELGKRGHPIIPAESGELASGLHGEGRMAEPETILEHIKSFFTANLPLKGKKALVNAGPTYEAIDAVRFIGNRSSGKMGCAIAECLAAKGAEVTLVLGPSHVKVDEALLEVIRVETAAEMYQNMLENYSAKDLVICSAAVADYRPENPHKGKMKKQNEGLDLKLVKTPDILAELGKLKTKQYLVGFALETDNLLEYAGKKLKEKNLDMVVANRSDAQNPAFNSDLNQVVLLENGNKTTEIGLNTKKHIAEELVSIIVQRLQH